MNGIACAYHPDRLAMGYCSGCGKALCAGCIVRLTDGNYCQVCAETPDHRPPQPRAGRSRVWLWIGLAGLITIAFLLSRML